MLQINLIFLNVIIIISASIVLIIPLTGTIWDGRQRNERKLKFKGWVVIFSFIIGALAGLEKEEKLKSDASIAEASMKGQIAKNYINTIQALAKYNLKYDSSQKIILKTVRDSAKRVTIMNPITPEVNACLVELKQNKDTLKSTISYCTTQAASSDLAGKVNIVVRSKKDVLELIDYTWNFNVKRTTIDNSFENTITLGGHDSTQFNKIYFYIRMKYKDSNGKNYEKKELISNTLTQMIIPTDRESRWVLDYLNKKNIK